MKTLGIIGGIAPPSTIDYYRQLTSRYRARDPSGSYPSILINSVDGTRFLPLLAAGDRRKLISTSSPSWADSLAADLGLFASNTPASRLRRGGARVADPTY